MTKDDRKAIASYIRESHALKDLKLSAVQLGYIDIDDQSGMIAVLKDIGRALEANQSLVSLDLSFNNLMPFDGNEMSEEDYEEGIPWYEQGFVAICQALKSHRSLTKLDMSGLAFDECAIAFAQMLTENTTLTDVSLEEHAFEDRGVQAMCAMLSTNRSLRVINLSTCDNDTLVDKNWCQILDATRANEHNKIHTWKIRSLVTDDLGRSLANYVSAGTSLTHLDISNNYVEEGVLRYLSDAIEEDPSFYLNLNNCHFKSRIDRDALSTLKARVLLSDEDLGVW